MRAKRSDTLIIAPHKGAFHAFNYVTGSQFECGSEIVSLLADLSDWHDDDAVAKTARHHLGAQGAELVPELIALDALIEEHTPQARNEDTFRRAWRWGTPSAILHCAVTDRPVQTLEEQGEFQRAKAKRESSPPLGWAPLNDAERLTFREPDLDDGLFAAFAKRRTVREGVPFTLELDHLADMLFAGFGITDWTDGTVGKLPLKFAPSGGARNPFDAYVLVRDIESLTPGAYRYSGIDHCIVPLPDACEATIAAMLSGQDWSDNAACLIVMVADFARPMWKYEGDDNAYRVVMIEAGHIAQNVMLTAADFGLSACPSAALNHKLADDVFGLRRFEQSAIYALAINKPDT